MILRIKHLLLLALLSGCAGTHHKHPHDHGLSAVKGHQKQLNRNISGLAGYLRVYQMELAEHKDTIRQLERRVSAIQTYAETSRNGISLLKKRLSTAEEAVRNSEEQLPQIVSDIILHTAGVAAGLDRADRNIEINQALIKTLRANIASLEKRLNKAEKLLTTQKKEDDKKKPWDGKPIGPEMKED